MLKFQSRARYDGRVKILKLRRITAAVALNLKTDRRARNFRIDLFAEPRIIDLFAEPCPWIFSQRRVPKFSTFGEYKQRNATVRTRGFDGAGR